MRYVAMFACWLLSNEKNVEEMFFYSADDVKYQSISAC